MTDLEIVPAARLPLGEVAEIMNRGYSDYFTPIQLDEAAFAEMVRLQDIALEETPVAMRGGVPVGIALLGLRGERAWIGGLAVPPEERRHGAGRLLMRRALEHAAARGARAVDLEVLVQNAPAIPLYEALGFRDTRSLGVFVKSAPAEGAEVSPAAAPESRARELPVEECLAEVMTDGPLAAPWQRGRPVITRCADRCVALGVDDERGRATSAILYSRPGRTSILHFGTRADTRPGEIRELIEALVARAGANPILLLNHPEGNPIEAALLDSGFTVPFRQREMRLAL